MSGLLDVKRPVGGLCSEQEELIEHRICKPSVLLVKELLKAKLGKSFRLVPTNPSFNYHSIKR